MTFRPLRVNQPSEKPSKPQSLTVTDLYWCKPRSNVYNLLLSVSKNEKETISTLEYVIDSLPSHSLTLCVEKKVTLHVVGLGYYYNVILYEQV